VIEPTVIRLAGQDFAVVIDEVAPPVGAPAMFPRTEPRRGSRGGGDPAYVMVTLADSGRSEHECRSSLLTAGAKAAVLSGAVRIGRAALRDMLAQADPGVLTNRDMARFGTELARALLPRSVRDGLATMGRRPLVIVHDREASRVPWEALRVGDAHPALECGLSRRYASDGLTVARWREDRSPSSRTRVLMVVNPTLDLAGAAQEGNALRRILLDAGAGVDVLEGRDATRRRLLAEVGSGEYDILHFAGHGYFNAADPGRSGLVCAGSDVLRGEDLDGIGDLPSLVFFNACEAARVRRRRVRGRPRLFGLRKSSGLAEAFLDGGVANFVGTHWPVGDEAALAFSTRFYERLLGSAPLGASLLAARRRVFELDSIDWADYVHYGNPAFVVGRGPHEDET
jgi:hypothetical protein